MNGLIHLGKQQNKQQKQRPLDPKQQQLLTKKRISSALFTPNMIGNSLLHSRYFPFLKLTNKEQASIFWKPGLWRQM